jgi:glyoxylate reductase
MVYTFPLSNPEPVSLTVAGAGYDQIDVAACTSRKIHVSNVPGAVDDATADTGVFLALGALRGFSYSLLALRKNQWRGNPAPPLGHDPEGKTLGILGMGGIGKNMARKLMAFGMKVIYHNRTKLDAQQEGGASYVGFDELLAQSDVLSLNLPLNVSPLYSYIRTYIYIYIYIYHKLLNLTSS